MNDNPSTLGSHGKDEKGRFTKGNHLGRGNPLAGRAAKIRAQLLRLSTSADVKEICRKLIDGAKGGDLAYIREWFDRVLGKPVPMDVEQRLAELERLISERLKDEQLE